MTKDRFITQHPLPEGREREILNILIEECAEVQQRVTKALRFGLDEIQEGQALTNAERIAIEVGDLQEMLHMCLNEGILNMHYMDMGQLSKRRQLAKYMQHQVDDIQLDTYRQGAIAREEFMQHPTPSCHAEKMTETDPVTGRDISFRIKCKCGKDTGWCMDPDKVSGVWRNLPKGKCESDA